MGRSASRFAALTALPQATTYLHSSRCSLQHCLSVKVVCDSPRCPARVALLTAGVLEAGASIGLSRRAATTPRPLNSPARGVAATVGWP
jgi:hypothetical protein